MLNEIIVAGRRLDVEDVHFMEDNAFVSLVFDTAGRIIFAIDSNDLSIFLRGQDCIAVAPDVDTLVHTLLAVCRILPHTER